MIMCESLHPPFEALTLSGTKSREKPSACQSPVTVSLAELSGQWQKTIDVKWADSEALRKINTFVFPHVLGQFLATGERIECVEKLGQFNLPQWAFTASRWVLHFWTTSRRLHDHRDVCYWG